MKSDAFWLLLGLGLLFIFKSKKRRQKAVKIVPQDKNLPARAKTPEKPAKPAIEKVKPASWLAYRELLATKESAGKYDARRRNSQFWGRYQLVRLARSATDAKGVRWDLFKKTKQLQDRAIKQWTTRNLVELQAQPEAREAVAANKATWSQLAAMDHLTGRSATMAWLRTGKVTKDANGVSNVDWGRAFAPFDLTELEKGQS